MPKMHLILVGFTYSACGPSTKNKERIQILKEIGDSQYIHQKELNKACFQHDMAYADFKDLTRRTASRKILCVKSFHVAKNPKYDGYQRGIPSMVYKICDKKTSGKRVKNKNISNKESSTELQKAIITKFETLKVQLPLTDNIWGKAIITKFETLKVQSPLTDNIWGADLAEI